jgi:hypothetical protein
VIVKRALALGSEELRSCLEPLGLVLDLTDPEVVLVDADDADAVAIAAGANGSIPRIFVASSARADLLRAAGAAYVVARPFSPSTIGPALLAIERATARPPRTFLFLSASGATGRTSLVANIGLRLARRTPVVIIDATGTGALGWRLGLPVAPWSDLTAVGDELSEAQLRLAAGEREGALVVGGSGAFTEEQLARVIAVGRGLGVVLVDGPAHWLLGASLVERADRILVSANPDPASVALTAALCAGALARGAQLVVSQAREADVADLRAAFGHAPAFLLPRDERACAEALRRRGPTGGALGRAYDAIAEIALAEVAA